MKFGQRLAITLVIGLLLSSCGDDPQTLLTKARQAYAAHDFKAAQINLANVLKAQPGDPAALELHARIALATGDGAAAKASLTALSPAKRPADFALLLGESALLREQPREALMAVAQERSAEGARIRALAALLLDDETGAAREFSAGETAPGPNARLLADYARFRLHQGDTAGAAALVARALKTDPASFDAQLVDARLAVAGGDLGRALAIYDSLGKSWPGNPLEVQGKLGEAAAVLAAAARLAADDPAVASARLRVMAGRGEWPQVRAALQNGEDSLDPQSAEGMLYGEALLRLGFAEQARARLNRTVLLQQGNVYARRLLAKAQLAGADPGAALATLLPVAEDRNAGIEELTLLAEAATAASDPAAGEWQARAAAPAFRRRAELIAAGQRALEIRDWSRAGAAFTALTQPGTFYAPGDQAWALGRLAWVMARAGKGAEAIALADRALMLGPGDPGLLKTAALARLVAGTDRARAGELLRQAQAALPQDAEIAVLRERLSG